MTVLQMPVDLALAMLAHARHHHPREACGVLVGRNGTPERHVAMENVSDKPTRRFAFDPDAQLSLWRAMDEFGEDPIVIWHSHTCSEAAPSATDMQAFRDPAVHYVIVTTADHPQHPLLRSWRLDGAVLVEEPVILTAAVT